MQQFFDIFPERKKIFPGFSVNPGTAGSVHCWLHSPLPVLNPHGRPHPRAAGAHTARATWWDQQRVTAKIGGALPGSGMQETAGVTGRSLAFVSFGRQAHLQNVHR